MHYHWASDRPHLSAVFEIGLRLSCSIKHTIVSHHGREWRLWLGVLDVVWLLKGIKLWPLINSIWLIHCLRIIIIFVNFYSTISDNRSLLDLQLQMDTSLVAAKIWWGTVILVWRKVACSMLIYRLPQICVHIYHFANNYATVFRHNCPFNPLDAKLFFCKTPVGADLIFSILLLGADLIFANLPLAPDVFSSLENVATPHELSYH